MAPRGRGGRGGFVRTSSHNSAPHRGASRGRGGRGRGGWRGRGRGRSNPNRNANQRFSRVETLDKQLFDYLIVVDFEATCEKDNMSYPNEIIEFPAILIDVRRGEVLEDESFHTYVKPWRNPILTPFCTELTGVTQENVDEAPSLQDAIKQFIEWYNETIPLGAKVMFATDGPWDFKNFLNAQAVMRDHVALPTIFYEYIDIRTTFSRVINHGLPLKLEPMLHKMGLRFEGRPHCGYDDSLNIARLAIAMMKQGILFQFICALPLDADELHYDLPKAALYRRADNLSGLVDRDHVEERAKAAFGNDYFSFGASLVAAHMTTDDSESITIAATNQAKRQLSLGLILVLSTLMLLIAYFAGVGGVSSE